MLAHIDFETYSEGGYMWDGDRGQWSPVTTSPPHGLPAIGAAAYSEHESSDLLCMTYAFDDGPILLWVPGMAAPEALLSHVLRGGFVAAWNSRFEYHMWQNVAVRRYGWPPVALEQFVDPSVYARSMGYPGKLERAAAIIGGPAKLDGGRLIRRYSVPHNPTKAHPELRLRLSDAPEDMAEMLRYCAGDVIAERAIMHRLPALSEREAAIWAMDQRINERGIAVDLDAVEAAGVIIREAEARYIAELQQITNGAVSSPSEIARISAWITGRGVVLPNLQEQTISDVLAEPLRYPREVIRVLEIRAALASASVKKLRAISRMISADGRIRDLFQYYGAATGRWAGRGPQPQNLPSGGPAVARCLSCKEYHRERVGCCPWCSTMFNERVEEWGPNAVESALRVIAYKRLDYVEAVYGNALEAISGCLRGLFVAAPGHDLICSDYSAIEAVVLAALAGEQWRLDVFRTHGKIYEMSASKITGVPFEDFTAHKERTGEHHPLRKQVGKVAELASGYQGSVGAWKRFGADKHIGSDKEILEAVRAWRRESPAIVRFWYSLEEAAICAVQHPGQCYEYRGISYGVADDILYCLLPSGRKLCYHSPRLVPRVSDNGRQSLSLTYMGSDSTTGAWARFDTYGGHLTENVVQAVARDILADAMVRLEAAGYPIVLHVHDEVCAEVPEGFGSIEEFERIMVDLPAWCRDWPIRAAGGWIGKRYHK